MRNPPVNKPFQTPPSPTVEAPSPSYTPFSRPSNPPQAHQPFPAELPPRPLRSPYFQNPISQLFTHTRARNTETTDIELGTLPRLPRFQSQSQSQSRESHDADASRTGVEPPVVGRQTISKSRRNSIIRGLISAVLLLVIFFLLLTVLLWQINAYKDSEDEESGEGKLDG